MTRQAAVTMKVGIGVASLSTEHDQTGCSDHEGGYHCLSALSHVMEVMMAYVPDTFEHKCYSFSFINSLTKRSEEFSLDLICSGMD